MLKTHRVHCRRAFSLWKCIHSGEQYIAFEASIKYHCTYSFGDLRTTQICCVGEDFDDLYLPCN